MRRKTILCIWLTAMAIMTISCQNEPNMTGPDNINAISDPNKVTLDIPEGAQLDSAKFHIFVAVPNRQTVNLHRVNADWGESGDSGVHGTVSPAVILRKWWDRLTPMRRVGKRSIFPSWFKAGSMRPIPVMVFC